MQSWRHGAGGDGVTCSRCEELRARVAELEFALGHVRKETLAGDKLQSEFGFTFTESQLVLALWHARGRTVLTWSLAQRLTADSDVANNTVKVHVSKLRRKIPPGSILTDVGRGYALSSAALVGLDAVLSPQAVAA